MNRAHRKLLADTALEDRAAEEEKRPPAAPPRAKGKALRQALPSSLPRIDRHYEIEPTHCTCGQAFKRIGEEVSEQQGCVPAQFFVLRHIRGKYACACCQTNKEPRPKGRGIGIPETMERERRKRRGIYPP